MIDNIGPFFKAAPIYIRKPWPLQLVSGVSLPIVKWT